MNYSYFYTMFLNRRIVEVGLVQAVKKLHWAVFVSSAVRQGTRLMRPLHISSNDPLRMRKGWIIVLHLYPICTSFALHEKETSVIAVAARSDVF